MSESRSPSPNELDALYEELEQLKQKLEQLGQDKRELEARLRQADSEGSVDIDALKQSEARARESEDKLRSALAAARMGTWDWDMVANEVVWSDDVEGIFGLEPGNFDRTYAAYLELIHPDDRGELEQEIARALADGPADDPHADDFTIEHRALTPGGDVRWIGCSGRVFRNGQGEPVRMSGTVTDVSARRSLEQQLRLAQRMETVGRLAGGVAHDFNNLLTAILGCAELADARPNLDPAVHDALITIREASERAAGLTRQLLTFARRQVLALEIFDLRELVGDTQRLLARIIGEDVRIETRLGSERVAIRADRAQIEQVLVNLAVNAREAMPQGGELTITVSIADVDAILSTVVSPGRYAVLELRDTGPGIDASTAAKIFDPFFTTKRDGNGLGLSTCYGIVKQLGGDIQVASDPGRGARFTIYLPLTSEPAVEVVPRSAIGEPAKLRAGRVLLAEDEAVVRMTAERGLRAYGYEVLAASDGRHALELLGDDVGGIDLLITDIVMPNMNGYELAERLRERCPGLPVVYVSGYAEPSATAEHGSMVPGAAFLAKPYVISRLAELANSLFGPSQPRPQAPRS